MAPLEILTQFYHRSTANWKRDEAKRRKEAKRAGMKREQNGVEGGERDGERNVKQRVEEERFEEDRKNESKKNKLSLKHLRCMCVNVRGVQRGRVCVRACVRINMCNVKHYNISALSSGCPKLTYFSK